MQYKCQNYITDGKRKNSFFGDDKVEITLSDGSILKGVIILVSQDLIYLDIGKKISKSIMVNDIGEIKKLQKCAK